MAKTCAITNKSSIVGGGYSNRVRATQFNPTGKRRRYANLQKKRVYVPELGKTFNLTITARAIKTINKRGAFNTLKKAGIIKGTEKMKNAPVAAAETPTETKE